MSPRSRIGAFCDVGPRYGAGHVVRTAAVGAWATRLGAAVELGGDLDSVPWSKELVESYGLIPFQCGPPKNLVELAADHDWDAVLLDSYEAQSADLAGLTAPLIALDDQALRPLPAQAIVNLNLSGIGLDYTSWPAETVLRGPRFASLRPEFAEGRPESYRSRDWGGSQQNVLIVCGGTDAGGAAVRLTELAVAALPNAWVRVIAATSATEDALTAIAPPPGSRVEIISATKDMVNLMNWADLALSTAGGTVWELCCLGVPVALVTVAANQREHYEAAIAAGIAVGLGSLDDLARADRLPHAELLGSAAELNPYGRRAWDTVDGLGSLRIAETVLALGSPVRLRAASPSDSSDLLTWRNDPVTRQNSHTTAEVSPDGHRQWFEASLASPDRRILIAELDGRSIGMLRYDRLPVDHKSSEAEWEVSINIAPERRGQGLAAPMLCAGSTWLRKEVDRATVAATVRPENRPMLRIFDRCGYRETERDHHRVTLRRPL